MPEPLTPNELYRWLQIHAFGADRAKLIRDVAEAFDVPESQIRGAIHDLRLTGHLIGTSSHGKQRGAYIPRMREEAVEGVTHLLVRLRAMAEVYEAQVSEINRQWPSGQMSLFDLPAVPAVDVAV